MTKCFRICLAEIDAFRQIERCSLLSLILLWKHIAFINHQQTHSFHKLLVLLLSELKFAIALCNIWPHIGALYSLKILPKSDNEIWTHTINITTCHIQFWAVSPRPLSLGQIFNFGEFSLFYWLKLSKSMSFRVKTK